MEKIKDIEKIKVWHQSRGPDGYQLRMGAFRVLSRVRVMHHLTFELIGRVRFVRA